MDRLNPYGGRNDRALMLVQETDPAMFFLRAREDDGSLAVMLRCNDLFAWACSDVEPLPDEYWEAFEKSYDEVCDAFDGNMAWFGEAWAVKLRRLPPQKPATDRYPELVAKLDWLGVPWRHFPTHSGGKQED